MKKAISVLLVLLVVLTISAQPVQETKAEEKTLTLYAYDTFCGDWGSAATLIPAFEEKTGKKIELVKNETSLKMSEKRRRKYEKDLDGEK